MLAETPKVQMPTEKATRVRMCDIGSGTAVSGVELVGVAPDGQESSHVTDSDGEFLVEGQMPSKFRSEEWKIVTVEAASEEQSVVLWAYRLMQLEIQVVGRSPVRDLEFDNVTLLLLAVEQTGGSSACSPVLNTTWINSHRLDRIVLPHPDSNGTAKVRVPMLPGYRVCASAPGWRSAIENMPCGLHTGGRILLELKKPSFSVTGTLKDAEGRPFARVGVSAYIVVEMPYDQVDKAAFRAVGHGYTYTTKKSQNRAVVCYMTTAATDSAGRFKIDVKVGGQLFLVARPRGPWQHVMKETGSIGSDVSNIELVAQRNQGTLTILRNGIPLSGMGITVSDIEDWRFNPTFGATLDERGGMTSGGFIQGHEYSVRLKNSHLKGYYFVWNGQRRIDLSGLPNRRASIRALEGK